MNDFKFAKDTYDNTEIPQELNNIVQSAVEQSALTNNVKKNTKHLSIYKLSLSAAAALLILLTIGLNTSESFAMEMQKIPVLGSVAKLLTLRSYELVQDDRTITVEIPAIVEEIPSIEETSPTDNSSNEKTNLSKTITDVNAEIEKICDNYLREAQIRADEYKQAFLETGGTEEEWKEHDIKIDVSYTIKTQSDRYLSFIVHSTENWTSAYAQDTYYNLNLQTGEYVTLKDILGEDYIELANANILFQMKERMAADPSLTYFDESMDGFSTITEDTSFYINETGNPVIVFSKYEIAPGAFGPQEFEIAPSCSVQ